MHSIMIIEDSKTVRQLINFALKRLPDANIVEAENGAEALSKLSVGVFDLIFVDINMPVMDGLKFIGIVRSNPKYRDVPIVVITTEGAETDRNKALVLGANAYLSKPIHTQELLKVVSEFLEIKDL